jgi:hypothetical protein
VWRGVYSRSPADPLSDGVLLPPTGIDVSTAIISARMSRTGCDLLATPIKQKDKSEAYLGDSLVVNVDQFSRVGVDLQCAVEAQSSFDVIGAYSMISILDLHS